MVKVSKVIAAPMISIALLLGMTSAGSAASNSLTEEQKQNYYAQYVEIVKQVMERKTGIHVEVPPMDQFQLNDWIEPKAYKARVENIASEHLEIEREKQDALSSIAYKAMPNLKGEMVKTVHIYVGDTLIPIEVKGKFVTRYDSYKDRQLFEKADYIATQLTNNPNKWEQTSYKVSLIDGGRTYSVRIEGIYHVAGVSFEKAFTIEFRCNEFGEIY